MKVIFNLTERQVQKALILSGLNDADMDKINKVLPEYQEIDITDFVNQNDTEGSAFLFFATFALASIGEMETE